MIRGINFGEELLDRQRRVGGAGRPENVEGVLRER
jgi:hypothetical protein